MPSAGGGAWLGQELRHESGPEAASAPALLTLPVPRRGSARAVLATLRPRQWLKNALVIAAAGAAGALGHDDVLVRVCLAGVAFCLLASGIYAINDVRDAEEDRLHPRKRFRPVAAGELDPRAASALAVVLIVSGLLICTLIRPLLGVVGVGYVALTLSYTPVALSRWFVFVVTFAAVFVTVGKRWSELQRTGNRAPGRRRVLRGYSEERLRFLLLVSGAGAFVAYCMWALGLPTVHGVPWRLLTIVPFALCLFIYGERVLAGQAEAPEELLLRDRWLLLAGGVWLVLFALGVHATS
jgi:decaprenyl-phosphate phosphoribosyltransferase